MRRPPRLPSHKVDLPSGKMVLVPGRRGAGCIRPPAPFARPGPGGGVKGVFSVSSAFGALSAVHTHTHTRNPDATRPACKIDLDCGPSKGMRNYLVSTI